MAFAALVLVPNAASGATYLTQPQALAEAFPGARTERRSFALTPDQARAVEGRAGVRLPSRLITAYPAWRGDTLAGTAFFESRTIRTMPGVFMVVVAPDTTIARVDVLAFHEPPDYAPPERWLDRFERRRLDERLWP
ncbi:MAG: FMN-binding protein, partial [Candidatus Eiseniibacteriota bacterium]